MSAEHHLDAFFAEHAVSPEVWRARPYERWEIGDKANVARDKYADLPSKHRRHVSRIVNQAPGILIMRKAADLPGLPDIYPRRIYPEMRPDWPVRTKVPTVHWHGEAEPPTYGEYIEQYNALGFKKKRHPEPGIDLNGPCPEHILKNVLFKGNPTNHIRAKDKRDPEDKPPKLGDELGPKGRNRLRNQHLRFDEAGNVMVDDQGRSIGQNTELLHAHHHFPKYVFPQALEMDNAKAHDHHFLFDHETKTYTIPCKRPYWPSHINGKHHRGVDREGPHTHDFGKVADPIDQLACRIDVHKLALPKIEAADLVFFVLEGCIKADAVLSAGGAVFSVPSVSLWNCNELQTFTETYLLGKTVIIVPDADWRTNRQVVGQARLCQLTLQRLGLNDNVEVAAPRPTYAGKETKGVDDFLAAGGSLQELVLVHSVRPSNIRKWVEDRRPSSRWTGVNRDARVIAGFSALANEKGEVQVSLRRLAMAIGASPKQVERAVENLESLGALEIEGDLSYSWKYFGGLEWDERPRPIFRLHEELRPALQHALPLGEMFGHLF